MEVDFVHHLLHAVVSFVLKNTTERRSVMKHYITKEEFEELLKSTAQKTETLPEDIREKVRSFLARQGISVGLPLTEQIRQARVEAGEQAVLESLRDKGLL